MLETTLNKIKAYNPCKNGWEKLLAFLGKTEADDEPLLLLTILESNGLMDAVWALRTVEGMDGPIRRLVCFCARQGLDFFGCGCPDDRLRRAIETAERFACGQASQEELADAELAAWAIVEKSATEETCVWAVADAVARAAARTSVGTEAWAAARAVAWTARAVGKEAAWEVFTEEFKRLCILGENYEHS